MYNILYFLQQVLLDVLHLLHLISFVLYFALPFTFTYMPCMSLKVLQELLYCMVVCT